MKKDNRPYVVARCPACKSERKIYAGDVAPGDYPMCEKCFMPMLAKSAVAKPGGRR